jgi:hypothetical protein
MKTSLSMLNSGDQDPVDKILDSTCSWLKVGMTCYSAFFAVALFDSSISTLFGGSHFRLRLPERRLGRLERL